LGKNIVCPGGNAQPRGRYGGGLYRGRGGQIIWRAERSSTGEEYKMEVNRGKRGDRTYYWCGKWGHMARNCWEKNKA